MSWSHMIKGPALEVARAVEIEAECHQKYLEPVEKSLHARAVALIVVACHEQPKGGYVQVIAFGDGGPNEQSVSVSIQTIAPEKVEFNDDAPAAVEVKVPEAPEGVTTLLNAVKERSLETEDAAKPLSSPNVLN